ncbi:MAG: hypothetical protein UY13_C0002G0156 [Candidatus Pacebacteria bacterium GW2011_GWB1_47_8]|nr:MAG: hypothetical protein UX28_C0001G0305 [Candidatus Pacebacteria bacterium GW2011_GWA1_46_10]KKU84244.1 MAG: hypothetical protein UY13_C0002G0156 [Candidatus Pacebacteria bacterium GW2011_GWB1_47_8]HCR81464.1 hypothetical protein [Candidatus Paceibacterota bacterium]
MAKKMSRFEHNPGMMLVISYVTLLITNVIVLYLAQMWFPQYLVLGTMSLTATWALWLSMGKLALINTLAIPFFTEWEHRRGQALSSMDWMAGYFVVNFVGLWLVTRFADIFGLGVTSWVVVAVLALALDFVQGLAMMKLEKWRTS